MAASKASRRAAVVLVGVALVAAACSSGGSSGSSATAAAPATTAAAGTTTAPAGTSTSAASAATTVPQVSTGTGVWDSSGAQVDLSKLQCTGAAPNPNRGVTATSIKVGGLATLSGAATSVWTDGEAGAKARFARANDEGGVNGRKIDYIGAKDDGLNPTQNTDAGRQLAENDQVFAVVPVLTSLSNYADTFCKDVVPAFGYAFNRGLCNNANTFGFDGCLLPDPTYNATNPSFAALVKGGSDKSLVMIGNDDTSAKRGIDFLAAGFKKTGINVVYTANVLPDTGALADPSPVIQSIMTANQGQPPAIVYWVADFANTAAMTQALSAAGYKGIQVNADGYDPRLAQFGGFQGSYVNLQWLPFESTDNAFVKQMTADLQKYSPKTPLGIQAAAGYLSADMFLAGLKAAGQDLTVDSFLKAMNSPSFVYGGFDGFLGQSKWPEGHFIGAPCGTQVQLKDNKYSVVVPLTCGTSFHS